MCVHACTGQWNLWLGCSGVCMSRDRHTCDNADYISYQMHVLCINTTSKHAHNLLFHSKCPLLCVYIRVSIQSWLSLHYNDFVLNTSPDSPYQTWSHAYAHTWTQLQSLNSLTVKADHLECMNLDTIIHEIFAKLKFLSRTKLMY